MQRNHYLRCNYGPGMFSSERTVSFMNAGTESAEWIWVNTDEIIPDDPNLEKGTGLVEVVLYDHGDEHSLIGITDLGARRLSRFVVPSHNVSAIPKEAPYS